MNHRNILVFSPSQGTTGIFFSLKDTFPDLNMDIIQEPELWDEAAVDELETRLQETEYSCIAACRQTVNRISLLRAVPCFELQLSDYDILTACSLAKSYVGKQILLIDHTMERQLGHLLHLLQIPVPVLPVSEETDLDETLARLSGDGCSLFIGDSTVYRACRASELNCLLMSPGYGTVLALLRQISRLLDCQEHAAARVHLFNRYMEAMDQGLLIYNEKKELFEQINIRNNPKLLSVTSALIGDVLRHKELRQLRVIHSKMFFIKGRLIPCHGSNYVVFEIKQSFEDKATSIPGVIMKNKENLSKEFYNMFYDDLRNSDFRNKVISYSAANNPILIIGESGTGKSRLADFIYSYSPYTQSSMFLIDCKQLDKRGLNHLFSSEHSPLYEYGITLYFKEVNLLKKKYTDDLINFLNQSAFMKKNKVIFSVTCNVEESGHNPLCMQLISKLNTFPLYLPPLRSRIGDIPNLAVLYIGQLNEKYHRHIAGFEPEAMNYLQGFYWDENIKQFKRTLDELFTMTNGPYISARNVISVLSEKRGAFAGAPAVPRPQPMTLDEIIQSGVRSALIANNMNQTKAAKELGISRTLLWRLLKKEERSRE